MDEIHLLLEWLYLRPAIANMFHDLFPVLFPPDHPERHVPLCGMTATFSLERMRAFKLVSDVWFKNDDILWAAPDNMTQLSIKLNISIGHSTLPAYGNKIIKLLRSDPEVKVICYFNDRASAINFKDALCKRLDEEGMSDDKTILIHGKLH
mmetsp:Transcript_48503/g.89989  ORF Transcript_48503/g.89989 Transcript_48503/m.89989 type:complete len:151 (-) Transcript_48503:4124-4576(-)